MNSKSIKDKANKKSIDLGTRKLINDPLFEKQSHNNTPLKMVESNKFIKIKEKKSDSAKSHKTPDRIISKIEKPNSNKKISDSNITSSNKSLIQDKNGNKYNEIKKIGSKIELTLRKSDNKKTLNEATTLATEKSEPNNGFTLDQTLNDSNFIQVKMNEPNNMIKHNLLFSHYNKLAHKHNKTTSEMSLTSISQSITNNEINFSNKIIELIDKIRVFLDIRVFDLSENYEEIDNFENELDKGFNLRNKIKYMNERHEKIEGLFQEIDEIHRKSFEIKSQINLQNEKSISLPNNQKNAFKKTKDNLEIIANESSEKLNKYQLTFMKCNNELKEIFQLMNILADLKKAEVTEQDTQSPHIIKVEESTYHNRSLMKHLTNNNPNLKENLKKNEENKIQISHPATHKKNSVSSHEISKSNKGLSDDVACKDNSKNELISEKLEKLKYLKEKKDQIIKESAVKIVKFNESEISNPNNLDLKPKSSYKAGNYTELDPTESVLNENVLIQHLPDKRNFIVKKPSNEVNFKYITEVDEEDRNQSLFQDSEIILHFENNVEQDTQSKINSQINQNNDTLIQTGNSFLKSHRRSKSHIKDNKLQNGELRFNQAKNEILENFKLKDNEKNRDEKESKVLDKKDDNKCMIV